MISRDQPAYLPPELRVAVSSRSDGTMLDRTVGDRHAQEIVYNRAAFCQAAGIDYARAVYQLISYGAECTYDVIAEVSSPNNNGVRADVLYTNQSNVALFLPVADCVATVIYDPVAKRLALAHLGRHSTIARTMAKVIEYFVAKGSKVTDLLIWMAPSVKRQSYRMEYFDKVDDPEWRDYCQQREGGYYLDLQGYNKHLALQAGLCEENIKISPINTAIDKNYFSHSQGDVGGRFAVVATITA